MPKSEPYSAHLMFLTTATWLPLPSTTCCGNFWTDLKPNITTNILFNPAYKKYEPMSYYPHTYHCQVHIPHWWPYYYSFSSFPKINAATMFLIYGPFLLDTWSILSALYSPLTYLIIPERFQYPIIVSLSWYCSYLYHFPLEMMSLSCPY